MALSLSELDSTTTIEGEKKLPNLADETQKQQNQQDPPADPPAGDPPAGDPPSGEQTQDPPSGEGTAQDPPPADDPATDPPAGSFWEDVDRLRGESIPVDFGTVDPESPEGALIRERAVEKRALDRFEDHMKKSDPRSYAYFLHRQAGKPDAEFFATKRVELPDYTTFSNNIDLQMRVYQEDLMSKGVSEKQARLLVDTAVKDNEIFQLADTAYKQKQESDVRAAAALQLEIETSNKAYEQTLNGVNTLLDNTIRDDKGLNFVIQEAKKEEFLNHVRGLMRYDEEEKKFYVAQEINQKDLNRLMESLYYKFMNGDLSGLVRRQAATERTRQLRRNVTKTEQTVDKSSTGGSGKVTLGEL